MTSSLFIVVGALMVGIAVKMYNHCNQREVRLVLGSSKVQRKMLMSFVFVLSSFAFYSNWKLLSNSMDSDREIQRKGTDFLSSKLLSNSIDSERETQRVGADLPSAEAIKTALIEERKSTTSTNLGALEDFAKYSEREIQCIGTDFPSAEVIKTILIEERKSITSTNLGELEGLARLYELVYAFIAAFQQNGIPIFVGYGSHMGARRHHGVIPFGEKDVDFEIFSLDEKKVLSIIKDALQSKSPWSAFKVSEMTFGYNLHYKMMEEAGFPYYIDFWLFDNDDGGNNIRCIGRGKTGCQTWYERFRKMPPTFKRSDYFPPKLQVFGSHKVPIPAKSSELETFEYEGSTEHWNTTCGAKKGLNLKKKKRRCSLLYDKYPFVFSLENGFEELRQGGVVIHRSNLTSDTA